MTAAADRIRLWREKPPAMVEELFGVVPDAWQRDVLGAFPHNQRQAMKACKGPGKTTVLSWIAWNFLLTRPHPKIAATSISADNLMDGLWTEMAKWRGQSDLLKATFEWTKTRIFAREHPETWWMSARTWSKSADKGQQADTLAGLHADYLLFILDEVGGTPEAVLAAAEAGLASGIESHIVMAGNPTHLEGPLYRASTTDRAMWSVTEITGDPDDPKRSPRVSVEWARDQIRQYGRDNPWVLVNVFGQFPPSSLNALIGPEEVREAMTRHYREGEYSYAAKIMGVDVARDGDDRSVIAQRQGVVALPFTVMRNVDGIQGAGRVAAIKRQWASDAEFVDNTGGYGGSWVDQLRVMGHSPTPIQFSGKPTDQRYYNKRTEMHFELAQWVKDGGALPPEDDLVAELSTPTYSFKGDRMILQPKEAIKETLGRSPDLADALALTFAHPVMPGAMQQPDSPMHRALTEYDPYE